jgi:Zn-dependent peptidase ImmA (M78 family)
LLKHRPIFIEPPRLTFSFIQHQADKFRNEYVVPPSLLPVPIVEIVELKLGLIPIPVTGLLDSDENIDGFLTNDLKSICVDRDIYLNPRNENRLRFTYAHEIGHLVLHKAEVQQCDFRTVEDWKHFHEDFRREDRNWFEIHAYEFAGRLLVPKEALESELITLASKIELYRRKGGRDEEGLIDAVAVEISGKFQVSPEVISKRIHKEKLQSHFRSRR